jgi:hypothetical protein
MPLSSHITPEPNPPLDRARVIRAREMYAEGFTVSRILAHCQMSLGTLYACLDGAPFGADGERMPALPRRRDASNRRRSPLKPDPVSLTNRLIRAAERQVIDIETRLSARTQSPVERERDVRMLMNLTRALRDLHRMQKPGSPRTTFEDRAAAAMDDEDEDMLPADIAALVDDMNRKLAAMADEPLDGKTDGDPS